MINLTSTSDKLQVINTPGSCDIDVHSSWVDLNGTTVTPGRTNIASITTATTTDIVAAPASSTTRNVKYVSINNHSTTVTSTVEVYHTDGTNANEMLKGNLSPGESLIYNDNMGWQRISAAGVPIVTGQPFIHDRNFGIAGSIAETIDRRICTETNTTAPTASGTLFMQAIWLNAGQVCTNISFHSATTASATPTNGFFALYDGSRNLLAQTANFTTEAWAATSIKTKALTTPYTVPLTGLYYVAIMITATTIPTLKGNTARTGGQLASQAPIIAGASTTGLTTTLPNPAAAITANGLVTVWAAIN